jgi:hypothetical protein
MDKNEENSWRLCQYVKISISRPENLKDDVAIKIARKLRHNTPSHVLLTSASCYLKHSNSWLAPLFHTINYCDLPPIFTHLPPSINNDYSLNIQEFSFYISDFKHYPYSINLLKFVVKRHILFVVNQDFIISYNYPLFK